MSDKHVRDNPNTDKAKRTRLRTQRARPTIGYLTPALAASFSNTMWSGAVGAAQERDVNLITFICGQLRAPGFARQANVLFDLAGPENINGIVFTSNTLNWYVSLEDMQELIERYRPLPATSIGRVEGVPSVAVDNEPGMREMMSHLIKVHGYRRIALVQGMAGHPDAEARYRAYAETLAEHNIPLDPDLVTPPYTWQDDLQRGSLEAIQCLLDERQLRPQVIIGNNDSWAVSAIQVLQEWGIQVPYDMAVVGYDDGELCESVTPPLSTVYQPIAEPARWATEAVLALLQGERVPEQTILPSRMVVRQSCGCADPALVQAQAERGMALPQGQAPSEALEAALAARRTGILAEMAQAVGDTAALPPARVEQLLDTFTAEMQGEAPGAFLRAWDEVLRHVMRAGGHVAAWHGALSALRCRVLPALADNAEAVGRAENLWQQARLAIGETARRVQVYRQLQAEQQAGVLREIGQALISTFNITELMDVLAQGLPRLGIPACYLALFENPQAPTEGARLILAYNEGGRIELEPGGRRFPSRQLVPEGLLPQDRRCTLVAEALYFGENQLGFVLFEVGPREGAVYDVLRAQISSALRGTLLLQERAQRETERERLLADLERRSTELQTAAEVSRAASSILNLNELLPQTVELIRDRFNLYYVGLFLVEETGQYAVLQAGTGEAGRKMLEAGHKLKVGGDSMIGWCAANTQARIALDVGEDAVRFGNPLLPLTRSEMALPLISRGRVIGALTIQSAQPAAFTPEDITVLQTMADQLANAIENARLFTERTRAEEALAQEQYLMQALMDNVPDYIYFKDRESRFIRISKSHAQSFGLSDSAQAVGKTDFDFFTEEHARPAYEDEQTIIQTGQPLNKEEKETRPGRPDAWVSTTKMPLRDKDGHRVGTFGISRDITERKRTEEALAYEQYLLNSLLDNAPYRIYFKDAEGRFIRVNRAWAEQHDLDDPAQAIGKTDFDFVAEKNARSAFADEQAIIKTGQPLMDKEATRTLSDGRQTWSSISKQPLRDKDGQIVGTFGISRDITERKRLMADLERRALQLQTAAEVSRAASSILNVDELLPQVVELIRARFNLYYTGLFLVEDPRQGMDETGQWVVLRAGTGEPGRKMLEAGHKLKVDDSSMIGSCVAQGKADVALDTEKAIRYKNPHLPETRSEMALPLISRGRVIGAMTIQSAQPAAFTQDDITILQTMADQVANAIENARLFEDTKSRLAQLTALQETTKAVASTLELDKLLHLITEQATTLLQGDGGIINLVDWEKKKDEVVASSGSAANSLGERSPMEGNLSGWVTLHNQAVISNQLQQDSRADVGGRSWRSAAIAPLAIKDQVMGTLVVLNKQGGKGEFGQADLDLLTVFANQAATAIENARLFDESRRARVLLDKRVRGLDCLNDIGRKLEETVSMPRFLQWVTERIPPIMQYPDLCVVAIEYRGQVYGVPEALALPRQMVQGLHISGELVGRLCIAYTEEHGFLDEESALLGDIARRVNGYLENQWLFSETQARARREQTLREITTRVRSSMDPDTVLRTAIRELGTALGRPSFVRLGSAEQLSKAQSAGGDGKNLTQEGGE